MHTIDTIGIDLGTTNSVVAIWNAQTQQVEVLNNHEGEHLTPSVVLFDPQQPAPTVGQSARIQALQEPERVIYSVKRFIGRTFQDEWVRYDQEHVTYSIEETPQHKVIIKVGEQRLTPSQISAAVLRKLKQDAEAALGERPITRAIITVPAYFNDAQRQATKEAANLAGLEVLQLLSEPNAAALAFGLGTEPQTFAVFDLGGGTFDLSLLQLKRGGLFRVVGTKGDTHLGGDDIDLAIVQWLLATLERDHNITLPLASDPQLRARLRTIAEAAKIALTTAPTCTIDLSPVPGIDSQQPNLQVVLTQKQLADLLQPFIQKTLDICDQALAEARLTPDAIDQVLLVGGQTRTPFIKAALHQHYGWYVNDTVNPDEVVARGAAILAARYCGYLKDQVRLMDVIPLSLGIALNDGSMKRIIEANTHIPTRKPVKNFTTQRDGQEQIRFCVYQGERPIASDNVLIGEVILPLTLSRPAGAPHITCTFQVDRDGSLHVYAQDEDTDSEPVKKTFISILVSILNRNGGQEWG